jgi:hypothetical protein
MSLVYRRKCQGCKVVRKCIEIDDGWFECAACSEARRLNQPRRVARAAKSAKVKSSGRDTTL